MAAIGGGFYKQTPNHRPFSPVNPDISFPYVDHEKVSSAVLFVVSLIAPAILTAIIALALTPGTGASKAIPRTLIWKRKLWEWNTAWLGLALGLATTWLFTQGIKVLIGKPRPDLLSRCDLDPATVQQFALGGYGTHLPEYNLLVSWTACRATDRSRLDDGFQSFPSGHASISFAGMVYLSLYVCSRFAIRIPYLLPFQYTGSNPRTSFGPQEGSSTQTVANASESSAVTATPLRGQAAAPPAYLVILPIIFIATSTYIATTRFSDFRHHGFDIICGAVMGTMFSYLSFRMYHLPIRRGDGSSWTARGGSRAWWIGVGTPSYSEDPTSLKNDIELGYMHNGS